MAKVKLNPALASIGGAIDGWVYRQQFGQTIIAAKPTVRADSSPAQRERQEKFARATEYARDVLRDPLQRKSYQALATQRAKPVNALLIKNWLTPPTIVEVDLADFRGATGDVIRVLAHDDIEVVAVDVTVETAAKVPLLCGAARSVHGVWQYEVQQRLSVGPPMFIRITASNRAGRAATRSVESIFGAA
ncbi:MAG: hypothetical protein ABIZ04_23640 [Opitutus sp.]